MLKIKEKKAATMVETAAMLFFIFAFLGLMITGGQMVTNKLVLNYATQAATRAAAVQTNSSDASKVANEKATKILKSNGISTGSIYTTVTPQGGWQKGNNLEVKVQAEYKTLFPVPNSDGQTFSTTKNIMTSRMVGMIEGGN